MAGSSNSRRFREAPIQHNLAQQHLAHTSSAPVLWDYCPHTSTLALHGTTTGVELHCVCVGIPDYPLRRYIGRQVGPGGGTYTRWATPHVRRGNRWTSSLRSPTSFRLATIKQSAQIDCTSLSLSILLHLSHLRWLRQQVELIPILSDQLSQP